MKVYGSISRLVSLLFRKNSQDVVLEPNQATTYTATRTFELPPGDTSQVLASATSTQTLTNKTISGSSNTLTVLAGSQLSGVVPVANGGTNSSTSLNNNRVITSVGGAIVEAAAITAARALVSDANGIPTQSAVTTTELGYVSGVTSAIQTQFTGKVAKAGDTMSGNLLFANQTEVRLLEATGNGTNYVGHRATASLAADTTYSWVAAPGVAGYVLASDTSGNLSWVNNASSASFKQDWNNADGTSLAVTHSLGSTDVMVQIFDTADGSTLEIDTVIRTNTNTVTLTASEAPAVTWRVLVLAV